MKVTIEIEQFDNGITLKWTDADEYKVAYECDQESIIGRTVMDDIKYVMDDELVNKVRMKIEYEPIKDGE